MMTMMKCSDKNLSHLAYATLCGVHHKQQQERNQDALSFYQSPAYCVFCVADGVGSHKHSRKGSRAVARAVKTTFKDYVKGKVERKKITSTIFSRFKSGVKEKYRGCASTTCLFVAAVQGQGIFIGQAGDGLVIVRVNGVLQYVSVKDDDFSNEVVALSPSSERNRWTTRYFKLCQDDKVEIFLSTDGISGDVIPGHEEECLDYFLAKCLDGKRKGNKELKQILKAWSENGSNDDKTVIIYKNR